MKLAKHFVLCTVVALALGFAGNAQACVGDSNDDGTVDVVDLLAILAAWGPCDGACGPADSNGDGTVDVVDLLAILAAWGPCPNPCDPTIPDYYDPSGSDVEWAASGVCAEMNGIAGPPACQQEQHNTVLADMNYILDNYDFTNAVFDHTAGGGQSFYNSPYLMICYTEEVFTEQTFADLNACYHADQRFLFDGSFVFVDFLWGVNVEALEEVYGMIAAEFPGGGCEMDRIVGNYPTGFHAMEDNGWNHYDVVVKETCDYDGCRCHAEMGMWSDGMGTYIPDGIENFSGCIGGTCCEDPRFDF